MERWSENEISEAIKLCGDGKNYREIAEIIGRTTRSIRVKLNRLGVRLNEDVNYETVLCGCCGNEFKSLKNDKRKFCSRSCSATINNKLFPKRKPDDDVLCLGCGEKISGYYTHNNKPRNYCNNDCRVNHNKKTIFDAIENDVINLENKITEGKWVKKYLIEKHGEKCMECGWNRKHPATGNVPIELEHIDGNSENNKLYNLKLLCPNCHSLTPTYKALNAGNGRHRRRERYKNGLSY